MSYKVYVSLENHMNEGWVWLTHPKVSNRSIVKIEHKDNKKVVFCEGLMIDNNYRKKYDENENTYSLQEKGKLITMNSWYRKNLGITETNENYDLTITTENHFYDRFRACTGHPQVVVRLAIRLSALSVGLGLISFVSGIIGILCR